MISWRSVLASSFVEVTVLQRDILKPDEVGRALTSQPIAAFYKVSVVSSALTPSLSPTRGPKPHRFLPQLPTWPPGLKISAGLPSDTLRQPHQFPGRSSEVDPSCLSPSLTPAPRGPYRSPQHPAEGGLGRGSFSSLVCMLLA